MLSGVQDKFKRGSGLWFGKEPSQINWKLRCQCFGTRIVGLLVTGDKHLGDLLRHGHINYIIKKAVQNGVDPITAIKMGSYNTARYFRMRNRGAAVPWYKADFAAIDHLEEFHVLQVYKFGNAKVVT